MSNVSPYSDRPHPVTGMSTGRLAICLFLGSEVMLFGALVSTYLMLRLGAPGYWPYRVLSIPIGSWNTGLLLSSSFFMFKAVGALKNQSLASYRKYLGWATGLGGIFLGVKAGEWLLTATAHLTPAVNNFYALYYLMTGVFALHLIAAVATNAYFLVTSPALWENRPALLTERAENTGLFWHFLTLVWLVLFALLYLY